MKTNIVKVFSENLYNAEGVASRIQSFLDANPEYDIAYAKPSVTKDRYIVMVIFSPAVMVISPKLDKDIQIPQQYTEITCDSKMESKMFGGYNPFH